VHFHWIPKKDQDQIDQKELIDLEYQLRPRITRFIMDTLGFDCCDDFSCFHFELDMEKREIRISDQTPEEYSKLLRMGFHDEIGANCC
jgi:hypothetical protein